MSLLILVYQPFNILNKIRRELTLYNHLTYFIDHTMQKLFNTKNNTLFQVIFILVMTLTLSACFEPPPYNNLDNQQLKTLLRQKVPIIDIRRPDEWKETGVIKNSKLLTFVDSSGRVRPNFIQQFTALVGKNDPVIIICRTGNRSDLLARHLMEQMGYTNIHNVRYGIKSWIQDDQRVVKPYS